MSHLPIDEHVCVCSYFTFGILALGACRRTGLASSGPSDVWTVSSCIAYKTNTDCFAVLARDENCSLSGLNAGFSDTRLDKHL